MERFVARLEEIPEDTCRVVRVGNAEVGIIRFRGEVYAYENRCLHQGGPVCRGEVLGKLEEVLGSDRDVVDQRFSAEEMHVICPWHGWEYDLTTGENVANRRLRLRPYPLVVRGGDVFLIV